ncbi:hypothetical protein Goarm_011337, partial [Gossypium armourianum]|nr:hypothetical protein [Gossypium armourianum]
MMKGKRKRFYNTWKVLTCYFMLHLFLCNFRMSKIVLTSLLRVLETRYNLQTSRHISFREMLGNFFVHLGHRCKSFPISRKIL